MHELSLAESVIRIVERKALEQGFSRVLTLTLEIGELAAVDEQALRFALEAVTRDTLAGEARIEITRAPGQAWCDACGDSVRVSTRLDPCPDCGGHGLRVTGGDAMLVRQLEVT